MLERVEQRLYGIAIPTRGKPEKISEEIIFPRKIINSVGTHAESRSISGNKLISANKIISAQIDSLSCHTDTASEENKINLENKLLLDALMSDTADAFISQFDSLTADACTDVVCSQPLSADLPSWPIPLTDRLDPGFIDGLHTSMPASTAATRPSLSGLVQHHS